MVKTLEAITKRRGKPKSIRVDNGPEFVSKSLDWWAYFNSVKLDFSRPGKPTDNAFIESFNGKFRIECLNQHWFMGLEDAQDRFDDWRKDYNEVRPHSSLENRTPKEFAKLFPRLAWEKTEETNIPTGTKLGMGSHGRIFKVFRILAQRSHWKTSPPVRFRSVKRQPAEALCSYLKRC